MGEGGWDRDAAMRASVALVGIVVTATLAAPLPVRAEIYKWVDEKGVVNYSNVKRPEGVKVVERLEEIPVTTVATPPVDPYARQRELALEARVQRLERDLYEAQQASSMYAGGYGGYGYDPFYSGYGYGYPGYYPGYTAWGWGSPTAGFRSAHFRRFQIVRPIVKPFPHSTVVVRTGGVRTGGVRTMRR